MIVVADSGPIHYLVLIGNIEVLSPLFSHVLIPEAVRSELNHARTPRMVRQWIADLPAWAEIRTVPHPPEGRFEAIGPGECEAILLAHEVSAEYLLVDDARARSLAERESLRTIGTIGILRTAARRGLIDFSASIEKLRTTNFRVSSSLLNRIRKELDPW